MEIILCFGLPFLRFSSFNECFGDLNRCGYFIYVFPRPFDGLEHCGSDTSLDGLRIHMLLEAISGCEATAATGRRIVPSNLGPLLEGHGGVLAGRSALHGREPRGVVGSPGHARDSQPWCRNHSSRRECRTGFAARRAAAKGETSTLFRQRLGILLDENLNGLFAGINLDTIRRVGKVDLVASSVLG
jgi:hypothetical protein